MIKKLLAEDYKYDLDGHKLLSDFDNIIQSNKKLVVKFFATWCGPCRKMSEVIEKINPNYDSFLFLEIDVDKFPILSDKFEVSSIPTLVFYKDGKPFNVDGQSNEIIGSLTESQFTSILERMK